MTSIWGNDGSGWKVMDPTGFPDEATLHSLVEQAPQMLPLSGSTSLAVLGREVTLGNGSADLIAIEPTGRLCVIEVKLAKNAEARRAVIAQVLTYAAYLRGMDVATLEQQVLATHLHKRGFASLGEAVIAIDQAGAFDQEAFVFGVGESLRQGAFRLVIVLDAVPDELVRLVGYLEAVAPMLVIDLITVAAYDVDGTRVLVPQRVDPEQQPRQPDALFKSKPAPHGRLVDGAAEFYATIDLAPEASRPMLQRLAGWAVGLENEGLVRLQTYHGTSGRWTLLPRLQPDNAGLVTIWNADGAYISLWRSVFERRAPLSIPRIEALLSPANLGQGTYPKEITDELLAAIADAYREATSSAGASAVCAQ